MNEYKDVCLSIDNLLSELGDVSLTLATKTVPKEVLMRLSCDYPQLVFGENRVQELNDKWFDPPQKWKFIGRLQRNKVKYLPGKVSMIESVDSLELAMEIERRFAKAGSRVDVLVEVNVGEAQKGGVSIGEVERFVSKLSEFEHIDCRGLMAVLPKEGAEIAAQRVGDLYRSLSPRYGLTVLSMGMSEDYQLGIQNGATEVRIGSLVFGQRSAYGKNG